MACRGRLRAVLSAALVASLLGAGCAGLLPQTQAAAETCGSEVLLQAIPAGRACIGVEDMGPCFAQRVEALVEVTAPQCAGVFGDVGSERLGAALKALMVQAFEVWEAVKEIRAE